MKILILNGSPRGKGLISRMLSVMAEEARSHATEVQEVQVSKLQRTHHPQPTLIRRNIRLYNYQSHTLGKGPII